MDEHIKDDVLRGLWAAVRGTLADREHDLAAGPRNVSQLARRMGVDRSRLAHRMREVGPMRIRGPWPSVEAIAEGLNVDGADPRPMDVEHLLDDARYEASDD